MLEAKFRESYRTTWLLLKQIWLGFYLQPRKKCFLLKYSTNIQKQHLIFTVHIRFLVQEIVDAKSPLELSSLIL